MTLALCFNCGETKFGAFCPCAKCHVGSSGDLGLDIAFSDHSMSVATIEAFGKVIVAIRAVCDDDGLRFWSFLRYISLNHSDILRIEQAADAEAKCDEVLARAHPPPVVVEAPRKFGGLRSGTRSPPDGPSARRWWWPFG